MAVEAISPSSDFFTFLIYETMYAAANTSNHLPLFKSNNTNNSIFTPPDQAQFNLLPDDHHRALDYFLTSPQPTSPPTLLQPDDLTGTVRKKTRKRRRRRPNACKNREEAETQRLTHIVMERNRRKQMNEHLAALKSLMPESYAQRGDQASIVGGAIEYVKELEHLLQSLEVQKLLSQQHQIGTPTPPPRGEETEDTATIPDPDRDPPSSSSSSPRKFSDFPPPPPPLAEFFSYPQQTWSLSPNRRVISSKTITTTTTTQSAAASTADIEVTLIETHANIRILSRKIPRQLSKLISGFELLNLTILHLNITSIHPLVLYSISAKVEEGCRLTSVDDIADATHQMLRMIEQEAADAPPPLCY